MDRDGVYASVIYGPNLFGLPIAGPGAQGRGARRATTTGRRSSIVTHRRALAVLPVLPTHAPEAAAAELERVAPRGHRGAIISPFEFRCSDPAWERFWDAAEAVGAAGQLPHRPGHVAGARRARKLGAGGVLRRRADAARRAARHDDLLGRARAPSEAAAGARRVAASAGCPTSSAGSTRPARSTSPRRRTTASRRSRARSSAARSTPPSRRSRSAPSSCRCSVPTTSCGRRTTRTPTARSRTRARRSHTPSQGSTPAFVERVTATNCKQLYRFA